MITNNPLSYIVAYIAAWAIFIVLSSIIVWKLFSWKRNKKRKDIVTKISLVSIGILVFMLLMEGYYGFFYDRSDSFGISLVGDRWLKRHYRYNNLGFRDNKDYSLKKADAKYRITFIGDSFTAGHGVKKIEDRFSNLIEARLRREVANGRYEIYTIAKNAWETNNEVNYFSELLGNGFETDYVILCLNINDIAYVSSDTYLAYQAIIDRLPRNLLLRHSFFLNFLYIRFKVFPMAEVSGYYDWLNEAYTGKAWLAQQEQLKRFIDLCRIAEIKLGVALFPLIGELEGGHKLEIAHEKLANFFKATGVQYTDLSERLGGYPLQKLMVNKFDAHPNEFAHSLIAEDIWLKLIKSRLQ